MISALSPAVLGREICGYGVEIIADHPHYSYPIRSNGQVMGRARAAVLARVFAVDVLRCSACAGRRRVLAFLMDPTVAAEVLFHLGLPSHSPGRGPSPISTSRSHDLVAKALG